jgi:hypothetical protein
MDTADSASTPGGFTLTPASGAPAAALASAGNHRQGQGRLVGTALAAGVLAGPAAWLASEVILETHRDLLSPKVKREQPPMRMSSRTPASSVAALTAPGQHAGPLAQAVLGARQVLVCQLVFELIAVQPTSALSQLRIRLGRSVPTGCGFWFTPQVPSQPRRFDRRCRYD